MPELSKSEYLKQCIGVIFNEENAFAKAKERTALKNGVEIIGQLSQLQNVDQTPYFSMQFLIQKYLGMSDDDLKLNANFKQQELLNKINSAKKMKEHQKLMQNMVATPGVGGENGPMEGPDFGGGDTGGFGGGDTFGAGGDDFGGDFGASDIGGPPDMGGPEPDMGGGPEPDMGGGPEPPAPSEPTE